MKIQNPYLDHYQELREHIREHALKSNFDPDAGYLSDVGYLSKPSYFGCFFCIRRHNNKDLGFDPRDYWASVVPDDNALNVIEQHTSGVVVELGAGRGYWAWLLQQRGAVKVFASDISPPKKTFTKVDPIPAHLVQPKPDDTLFICAPSYGDTWPYEAAKAFLGETIIYVGEGSGGCDAEEFFHSVIGINVLDPKVERLFEVVESRLVLNFLGNYRRIWVCKRLDTDEQDVPSF